MVKWIETTCSGTFADGVGREQQQQQQQRGLMAPI